MYAILTPLTLVLLGQTAPTGPDPTAGLKIGSVWDFVLKGGPVMIPIGLASIVALTVIVERLFSLRRARVIPPTFSAGLRALLGNGNGDRRKAIDYCITDASPTARIFAAGIKRLHEPLELLEKHVQEAGEREVASLRKHLRMLAAIGSLATLLGLLGTILGLIEAFQTVAASGEALGKTELLAKGIYEAMITTAAGLMVAIPVILSYHWISAKIESLVVEIDRMTVAFVEEYAEGGAAVREPGTHVAGEKADALSLPHALAAG